MKLFINSVSCIQASSGVSSGGANAFSGVVTVAMGALGAAAGVAAGTAATVATAGIGIPLTVALPALAGASAATLGLVITQGGIAATKAIGASMADELYITVNDTKVFPADATFADIKSGQRMDVLNPMPDVHDVVLYEGSKRIQNVQSGVIYSADPGGATATIKLWDHDVITADDLLATFPISLQTAGQQVPYIAASAEEESIYMIVVTVHP